MMEEPQAQQEGLFASLKTLSVSLIDSVRTRLELLSLDVAEERERLTTLLVSVLVALFCLGIGVVLLTILIVVLLWDTHRLAALGALAGVFLAVGGGLGWFVINMLKAKPRLFEASLTELSKDREQLTSES